MSKTYSAGIVTAYGAAKRAGYQGTYEDFCRQQAGYAGNVAAVETAKNTAVSAANTATTKATEATTAATAAQTAKTQTEAAASQALTDISTARSGAISAVQTEGQTQTANARSQAQAAAQSANTASTKASEASASATSAGRSATNAAASATSAATSASAAQAVLESIPEDYSDLSEDVDQLKADLNNVNAELATELVIATTAGHASMRYRWENNSLAIVSSSLYDITRLIPLDGCSGFYTDYTLTPSAGYGHTPICFFASATENTANVVGRVDTIVENNVYDIPNGAKYVGLMVPTGTHPMVTLLTSKISQMESAIADLKANAYGCSFPISDLRQTIGISETFYYNTAITPNKTTYGFMSVGGDYSVQATKGLTLPNETALEAINGFIWRMYNHAFVEIANYLGANGYGGLRHIVAENLSDCSLLAIGDSTVDSDTLTENLLSHFAEHDCTLTLLGTLGDGSGTNRNEGRSGWKASDYLTDKKYSGVTNPFYNPSSQTFDFAYYMTNQGYSAPTFVIIQLGINDLSAATAKEDIWSCIQTMIDSILDYNSSIKILLNLPTTPNSDQSKMFATLAPYWNRVVRYNQYAQARVKALYAESRVRCSYCHLILDPDEDIRDGVHPKSAGYAKMALEVVNQINCWQNGV